MPLKILCSGHLVRYPLGGHSWHHLQYLAGFQRLGHEVTFFENYGWSDSCYDAARNIMTSDPSYGIAYTVNLLRRYGLDDRWCYLAEDGTAHGMPRERLAQICRECDVYFDLSNINWIPELEHCRRRALVDTDPVFTQIGAHGLGGPYSRYQALFSYGENVHRPGLYDAGRQRLLAADTAAGSGGLVACGAGRPIGAVYDGHELVALGDRYHEGRLYGQKDREFGPYFSLPRDTGEVMELAVAAPAEVRQRLKDGGWRLAYPREVTRDPWIYQAYLRASRAEFSVAKHGYVSTRCGWFSERSAAYMASGRPVVVQDTGFSDFLPCGAGLLAYRTPTEAIAAIKRVRDDYEAHCQTARAIVEEFFDARQVLTALLERSL